MTATRLARIRIRSERRHQQRGASPKAGGIVSLGTTRPEATGQERDMTANNDDDGIEIIGDPRMAAQDSDDGKSLTDLVEQPAKVMRIGTMIKQLLEEVRAAPLDDASRNK